MRVLLLGLLVVVLAGPVPPAWAQQSGKLPQVFDGVGVDERLGVRVPPGLAFVDETGRAVTLGQYFRPERPVLLTLVYHDCPMLCNLVLDGQVRALRELDWLPGREYEVVTVSFSPREGPATAARQKARYLKLLDRAEAAAGWHFLTGSPASIDSLTRAVGFHYRWVAEQGQYAHPAALVFLGPDGKITRYLYGLEPSPRNVRQALVEASRGQIGTALDQVMLFCFQYDPAAGSYVPHAKNLMKLGGVLTMLALGATLGALWRRERRAQRRALSAPV